MKFPSGKNSEFGGLRDRLRTVHGGKSPFRAGRIERAEEIQRRLNRCFPRGGEETLGHLGTTKVTASVVTGIDMGPARPPYMAAEDAADRLRKRLPALQDLL